MPAAANAARSEFFGVVQGQFAAKGQLDGRDLKGMASKGVHTNRFELGWKSVVPRQGAYNWSPSDRFIGALARRGIRAVPFVWGTPRWVAKNPGQPPIDSAAHVRSWKNFLKVAVDRYGPGGSYWSHGYRQRYGAGATPLPIHSWQVWNEPNLKKFFNPEGSDSQTVHQYARLLRISHDAIKSRDQSAQIVLAGNPGYPPDGGLKAWVFLDRLYKQPGIKDEFDVAALHPYASTAWDFGQEVRRVHAVMQSHGDGATPLWLTEFGWGSAPPDRFGINQGPAGQARLLHGAFELALRNRSTWNVQRLYWFLWRDPAPTSRFAHRCSFCGSAGLLRHDRKAKAAFNAYTRFSADKRPPRVVFRFGPRQHGHTKNPTPTFGFHSTEPGSTFRCRLGQGPFSPCTSPRTLAQLSDGAHTFAVKATDAAGNGGRIASRTFTVDTHAPPAPRITDTDPDSPANDNHPRVKGNATPGPTVRLYAGAGCAGKPMATGAAAQFASPGLLASVADNTTTTFHASSIDGAGNSSPCSAGFNYVESSP
ncbi:MAG TPA: glycosyl hydrolase [Solirubrobacterales bacterium]